MSEHDTNAPGTEATTVWLRHGRIDLALHRVRDGVGRPLLLLHGLGEATPRRVPDWAAGWHGPVWGLDFTGHGDSTVPRAGGYSAEALLADTNAAIEHLGEVSIVGRGLGGYIALLAAGARPTMVHGAVIDDGPGLAGGGPVPGSPTFVVPPTRSSTAPDPFALLELARDVRPPDYAVSFARFALERSPIAVPIVVSARIRPDWLEAVAGEQGVVSRPLQVAIGNLGA